MFCGIFIGIIRPIIKKYTLKNQKYVIVLSTKKNLRYGDIFDEKQVLGISGISTRSY